MYLCLPWSLLFMICSYPAVMFAFPDDHIFFIVLLGILSFFDCSVPSATLIFISFGHDFLILVFPARKYPHTPHTSYLVQWHLKKKKKAKKPNVDYGLHCDNMHYINVYICMHIIYSSIKYRHK